MKNSEAWQTYKEYTRNITEFSRKLAFAGIAIVWLIRLPEGNFDTCSLLALALIVLYILIDISQYLSGAIRWRYWISQEEKRKFDETGSIEGEYYPPENVDTPIYYLFMLKTFVLILGFLSLGVDVLKRFV
jgi:hypothetical protein